MAYPELEALQTSSMELDRVQDAVESWIDSLKASVPFLDGRLIEDISISGSSVDNIIEHGLARVPRGLFVVKQDFTGAAVGTFTEAAGVDATQSLSLRVNVVGTFTISIWVF